MLAIVNTTMGNACSRSGQPLREENPGVLQPIARNDELHQNGHATLSEDEEVTSHGCCARPKKTKVEPEVRDHSIHGASEKGAVYQDDRYIDYDGEFEEGMCDQSGRTPCNIPLLCCLALAFLVVAVGLSRLVGVFFQGSSDPLAQSSRENVVDQKARLRITNGCQDEPLWVAFLSEHSMVDKQNLKLAPMESHDFEIPPNGLEGSGTTRWFSKWRCVSNGNSCEIGDSGGLGQKCDIAAGCAPPVDTKFNAKFGVEGKTCNTTAGEFGGCDFVDVSLQDGYTVPFKLEIKGDCRAELAKGADKINKIVDCTGLTMDKCPIDEILGNSGSQVSLKALNPVWKSTVGCFSPCSKLSFEEWSETSKTSERRQPTGRHRGAEAYCCPTLKTCNTTVVDGTRYAHAVHSMCPGINAYDYDNGMGVGTCPAGTRYEMIFFCPPHKPGNLDASTGKAVKKANLGTSTGKAVKKATPPKEDMKGAGHSQPNRLRITNGCGKEPLWIASNVKQLDMNNVKIVPRGSHDFAVTGNSTSVRYWPKARCNSDGRECTIGDSAGPDHMCGNARGCAPFLDTKFKGTFGIEGKPCSLVDGESDGCDFVDVGLVDGYTVPFKFKVYGDCKSRLAVGTDKLDRVVDCSKLSLDKCPCKEQLGENKFDMQVVNSNTNEVVGCYSPCSKLTLPERDNDVARGKRAKDEDVAPYCCPSPPATPESCREGPVNKTDYVRAIHEMCPGVHGYAYDHGTGWLTCPAGTKYEMIFFCPDEDTITCAVG